MIRVQTMRLPQLGLQALALTLSCLLFGAFLGTTGANAASNPLAHFKKIIFGCHSDDLAGFESFARRAKQSGATHIVLTGEDLPWAAWQLDTPGDRSEEHT